MPPDRPPTKAEVWAYVTHYYTGIKTEQEMRDHAFGCWVGNYVYWVNFRGWRRHPDWKDGDGLIEAACPSGPIFPDQAHRMVRDLYEKARAA